MDAPDTILVVLASVHADDETKTAAASAFMSPASSADAQCAGVRMLLELAAERERLDPTRAMLVAIPGVMTLEGFRPTNPVAMKSLYWEIDKLTGRRAEWN